MQTAIVLSSESASAGDLLYLFLTVPLEYHLCANCTTVALCSFQLEFNPFVFRNDGVLIQEQGAALIGDDHVQNALIPKIGERHGPSVINICYSHRLRHVNEFAR